MVPVSREPRNPVFNDHLVGGNVADVLDQHFVNQRLAERGLGRGDFADGQPRLLFAARHAFTGRSIAV